jgi:DNA-binding XRE family transcriptional regulator
MAKRDLSKLKKAAELRIVAAATQVETAQAVGVTERTIRSWEASDDWKEAANEARQKFMLRIAALTRAQLIKSLEDPEQAPQTARHLALKILPELQKGDGEKNKRPYVWWDMGNGHIAEFE